MPYPPDNSIARDIISGVRPTDDFFSRGMASIGFRARKTEPVTLQGVTIKVSASNSDIHPGTYSFNVLPSPLAITVNPPTISYGQQATVSVQKKDPDGTISPWSQDAGLSYEIIKGQNAGYIAHQDTARRDDFFNGQSDTIRFVALEESPQPDTAEVQFYIYVFNEGGGIATAAFDPIQPNPALRSTGLASVTVLKGDSLDHFAVSLEQDTIAFTETNRIFVVAQDRDSNEVDLTEDALLQFSIDSTAYGSFIGANGDTVPSPLANVLYSDAKAGNIRFAAVNKNPDSVLCFRVIARLQADTTTSGDTTLVLLEQTLKIIMAEPREVRPSIPTEDQDTSLTRLRRKDFEIQLTRGGRHVAHHPFQLRTDYVRKSGGHDHANTQNNTRQGTHANFGFFTVGPSSVQRRPLEDMTDANGRFGATYNASLWGDTMKIFLESRSNRLLRDSVNVVEKVAGLEELPTNADYTQIGGRCEHHGPSDNPSVPDSCQAPNNNHWADSTTVAALEAIAAAWHRRFPNEVILQINDLSLPLGGQFDINGQWGGAHETHRTGRDSDIRTDLFYYLNNSLLHRVGIPARSPRGEPFNTSDGQLNPQSRLLGNTTFEQLCRANGGEPDIHLENTRQEHYHIDFD